MRTWVLIALVLLSVGAERASAAQVTYDAGGIAITGSPGESSRLTVRFAPNATATVHDDAGGLRPGSGCLGTPRDVSCGLLLTPRCRSCSARIELGDANDTLTLAGTSQKGPFLVDAGPGDDQIHVTGDTNALVKGGPGRDVLRADAASELDGGDGPDVLQGDRATVSYASASAGVTVALDGAANDGAPGEGDNVTAAAVWGTEGADVLTGNDAANDLRGRGGNDILAGAGGNDTLHGEGGADRIDAGAGDDRVEGSGDDRVKCGPGTDIAAGLPVPGTNGDCEAVFETLEEPYLTVSDVRLSGRRPRVTLGWRELPGIEGPPITAAGVVVMRYRGIVIARGAFAGIARPARQAVTLKLNRFGRTFACRSGLRVRLLVVGTGQTAALGVGSSRSAIRRDARLPRVGTCAKGRRATR